jgi:hypothetical protein
VSSENPNLKVFCKHFRVRCFSMTGNIQLTLIENQHIWELLGAFVQHLVLTLNPLSAQFQFDYTTESTLFPTSIIFATVNKYIERSTAKLKTSLFIVLFDTTLNWLQPRLFAFNQPRPILSISFIFSTFTILTITLVSNNEKQKNCLSFHRSIDKFAQYEHRVIYSKENINENIINTMI